MTVDGVDAGLAARLTMFPFTCRTCGAQPGAACTTTDRRRPVRTHLSRRFDKRHLDQVTSGGDPRPARLHVLYDDDQEMEP